MNANDANGRSGQVSAATYLGAAAIAAIAGFVAVYVTLGWEGNLGAPQAELDAPGEPPAPAQSSAAPPAASPAESARSGPLAGLNMGAVAAFVIRPEPQDLPAFTFNAGDGAQKTLADWKGKVVLLNLWATWCAPCRKEMSALDRLQSRLGGDDFEVVAIATDRGDIAKPREFLSETGVANLKLFHEPSAKLPATLKAIGMPTTILIDRQGREIGRLIGPAEWDSPEAVALIEAAIAAPHGAAG